MATNIIWAIKILTLIFVKATQMISLTSIIATHMLVYLSIEARVILKYESDVPCMLRAHSDALLHWVTRIVRSVANMAIQFRPCQLHDHLFSQSPTWLHWHGHTLSLLFFSLNTKMFPASCLYTRSSLYLSSSPIDICMTPTHNYISEMLMCLITRCWERPT